MGKWSTWKKSSLSGGRLTEGRSIGRGSWRLRQLWSKKLLLIFPRRATFQPRTLKKHRGKFSSKEEGLRKREDARDGRLTRTCCKACSNKRSQIQSVRILPQINLCPVAKKEPVLVKAQQLNSRLHLPTPWTPSERSFCKDWPTKKILHHMTSS